MKRSLVFDAARALAVLHIVGLHHLQDYSPFLRGCVGGWLNVSLVAGELAFFFFCSAWLLARKTEVRSISDANRFWKRRCVRMLPLYSVALLLLPYDVPIELRLSALVGANNFLPGIAGHNIPTLWFVSVMVLFYLAFPLLRAIRGTTVQILVCAAIEAALFFGARRWNWDPRLWWYFPSYAAGVLAVRFDERTLLRFSVFLSAGFCALLLFAPRSQADLPVVHSFLGAGFLFALAAWATRFRFAGPFLSTVAYASMTAYLFHRPIYGFIRNFGLPPDGPARLAVLFGVWIPVVFLLGWIIQRSYDRIVVLLSAWTTRMKASRRPPG